MKSKLRLPKFLQGLFTLFEVLAVAGTLLFLFILSILPTLFGSADQNAGKNEGSMAIGLVGIEIPQESYSFNYEDNEHEGLFISKVQGQIITDDTVIFTDFLKYVRPAAVFTVLFFGFMIVFQCEMLRRLFKNLGKGIVFTQANVRNIHKLGIAMIVFTIGFNLCVDIIQYQVNDYVEDHIEVEGIAFERFDPENQMSIGFEINDIGLHLDIQGVLAGLIVLSLGEVFRRGLQLKEENELTI